MTARSQRLLVVTPTLGTSPWLDATVASVANLGLDVVHLLAAPVSELNSLSERYPDTLVVQDAGRTGGIYGALNAGLAQAPARWDWFTYINDDDLLLPAFGAAACAHTGTAGTSPVMYGDVVLIEPDGQPLYRITTETTPRWIPALLQQGISPLMQQGMLFRRDVVARLVRFDQRYRLCADLDFWLRAYGAGFGFRHCGHTVAAFRLRPGQLSHDTARTHLEQAEIVERHLSAPIGPVKQTLARWRYRVCNFPRYLARVRRRGFVTSYDLLERGGAS
jgi:hypothetical protein